MKNVAFILTVYSFFLLACKKDNGGINKTIEVKYAAEGLEYVQLPLNRYFIYKDSATGALDSVVVTESNLARVFSPRHISTGPSDAATPEFYYQTFTLTLTKFSGSSAGDWFYGSANNAPSLFMLNSHNNAALFLKERDRPGNKDGNYVFNYPFSATSYGPFETTILPLVTIEGKTYSNTVSYTHSAEAKSTYYWAKGTGIVKRTIRSGNSVKTHVLVRKG